MVLEEIALCTLNESFTIIMYSYATCVIKKFIYLKVNTVQRKYVLTQGNKCIH